MGKGWYLIKGFDGVVYVMNYSWDFYSFYFLVGDGILWCRGMIFIVFRFGCRFCCFINDRFYMSNDEE